MNLWETFQKLNKLYEAKEDTTKLIAFAGEDLANRFLAIKNRLKAPENDLYYWIKNKSVEELEATVTAVENTKSNTKIKKEIASDGAELVAESAHWKVYHITTYEAAQNYGRDTQWCITGINDYGDKYWKLYHENREMEFYFLITKGNYDPRGTNSKFAIAVYPSKGYEAFDQQDNRTDIEQIPYFSEIDYSLFNELTKVISIFTVCVMDSGEPTDKRLDGEGEEDDVLKKILAFIDTLSYEEKREVAIDWHNVIEEELVITVDPLSEAGDENSRYLWNWELAYKRIREALEEDPNSIEMFEGSSSYTIWLNGVILKQRKGIYDEDALEEIIWYIRSLSRRELNQIAISWNWDEETPGDAEGDIIVGIEKDENNEWDIIYNWDYAKNKIYQALGIR